MHAKAGIKALLIKASGPPTPGTWADENLAGVRKHLAPCGTTWTCRSTNPSTTPSWSADDPKKGCVVDKINEFRATAEGPSRRPNRKRRFALRFLIHCIEDMHHADATWGITTIEVGKSTLRFGSSIAEPTCTAYGTAA